MIAYMCKRFVNYEGKRGAQGQGYWLMLGVVYGESSKAAWAAAYARWPRVDSVYCLDGID